jgi:hypothetical protein
MSEDAPGHASGPPPSRSRRGAIVVLAAGVALAAWVALGPNAPKDNTVRLVLGDKSAEVTELDLRYSDGDEVVRDATLRYPEGAPRVVSHEVRIKTGEYRLEVVAKSKSGPKTLDRRLRLEGGTTQVDLVPTLVR